MHDPRLSSALVADPSSIPRIRDHRQLGGRTPWFNGWPIGAIAIDPRGRRVLTAGEQGLRLFEAASGELVRTFAGGGNDGSTYERIGFTADGLRAFAQLGGLTGKSAIGEWEVETGRLSRIFDATGGGRITAISRDGRRALARDGEADPVLWNLESGTLLRRLAPRPFGGLSAAAFVGPSAAVAKMKEGTAVLWDLESGAVSWERTVGPAYVMAAPESGEWFASAGRDGVTYGWSTRTGDLLWELGVDEESASPASVLSLAVSADGRRLVTADGRALRVWDVAERTVILREAVESETVVAIDPGGSWVVAGGPSGQLARVDLDAAPAAPPPRPAGHGDRVIAVAFGSGGRIFSADMKGILAWDATGTPAHVEPEDAPAGLLDSPKSPSWLWDLVDAGDLHCGSKPGYRNIPAVLTVALHPDGKRAAIGSTRLDAPLQLRDARAGTLLAILEGHEAAVTAVAFSADGTQLVSGSNDRTVRVWKIP